MKLQILGTVKMMRHINEFVGIDIRSSELILKVVFFVPIHYSRNNLVRLLDIMTYQNLLVI